jgi:mycothiol S-conjugate amidase
MCVHAHPDDESSKGAATMAKYVDAGHQVLVVSCTGGERGDVLNPQVKSDPHVLRDLTQVRRDEMARARDILGVQHTWLGFVDSGLPEGDPLPPLPDGCFALQPLGVGTEALVREIRRFRPHVITTYDENGGYPHPDHIRCHDVSVAAFDAAGDATAYPSAGPAWQPLKLYYNQTFSRARVEVLHEALLERGVQSPYGEWLENWTRPERTVTTRVECAAWFDRRDAALLAHATQIDPDGPWFQVPGEVQRDRWPTEDFEAAVSYVSIAADEDDLFAGLPEDVDSADVLALPGALSAVHDTRVVRTP